jgi:hypothetical protein
MRRLTIDMQALIDAMTMPADAPWRSFLDGRDGTIVELDAENEDDSHDGIDAADGAIDRVDVESDPERYHEIPRLESHEHYDIMAAFAASLEDYELSERLGDALHGRGAFSRFRRVVDADSELRDGWFAFQRDALIRHARRWLASLGVEPVSAIAEDAKRSAAVETPATSPAATPKIGLLDLVLLGAPEGKTELLDGQVVRQIHTPTTSEARSIFTRVARELCWFFDQPWRRRYVEGKTTFDTARAHLRVEDDVVQLWIDVPVATWKMFG